jgi:polyisoprenyl-teichoic acid--peptidoglycan teichoic acid transferase
VSGGDARRWWIGAAVATAAGALLVIVAIVATGDADRTSPVPTPTSTTAPPSSPSPATADTLTIELGRVDGRRVDGGLPQATVRTTAEAVRDVMTDVYTTGFVDPARWGDGTFPSLFTSFAPTARAAARGDLGALTLGAMAHRLEGVRPSDTTMDVRVIGDRAGRPLVAFATIRFRAIGVASGAEIPIRHDGAYVLRRSDAGWRVTGYDVASRVPSPDEVDEIVKRARFTQPIPSADPMFVLVIGSDARPGGNPARARADSIHIVGVNPRQGRASIVGIPRDSFVPVPGRGSDKINASLSRGGPELLVDTVERLSGVRIDAYVLTGFAGFERIIGTVGQIEIDIPYAMNDPYSHARFRAGRTRLNARNALAFSRNRHDARGGDFGRSLNQGRLLIAFLAELREDLRSGDLGMLPWLLAGARYTETDLDLGQMVDLLLSVSAIAPGDVRNRVVPGRTATIGGRSVVLLAPGARDMFRDLAGDAVLRH